MGEATVAQITPWVLGGAFALAFVFGAVGNRTNFCTMGAVSDWMNLGDRSRMRMWVLAIAVAMLGANALHLAGLIDLSKSIYLAKNLTWLSHVVGGLAFGFGMVLASGCGSKTLIRIGGGNLKSLVVFIMIGISAYMTLRGLFAAFRVGVLEPFSLTLASSQDLPSLLAMLTGMPQAVLTVVMPAGIALVLMAWAMADREFRTSFDLMAGGVVTGLVVAGGWYVSGHVGYLAENPETLEEAFVATSTGRMEAFSFVAPLAFTLEYLMLWTDKSRVLTFGIMSVAGVISGSAAYALFSGKFRWEGFRDAEDTSNHLVGGVLMGFGGITALGCTIGQGISGLSTLAAGSFITFAAIIGGAMLAMKYQIWRLERGA